MFYALHVPHAGLCLNVLYAFPPVYLLHYLNPLRLTAPPPQALSRGSFELKIDSFKSSSGFCRYQSGDCQLFFRVCLKHWQDVISPEPPCTYGAALTDILGTDSNSISESASVTVPITFKWPVSNKNHTSSSLL